jgi:hypothetical protein
MFARTLTLIGFALALAQAPAEAAEVSLGVGADTAVNACTDINDYAPTEVVEAVEDGLGDWLVWVEDKDGDLWMCNASEAGAVYANVLMQGDLLAGDGADLIGYRQTGSRASGTWFGPAGTAEAVCASVGNMIDDIHVVATVDDGLGDYLVWLKNGNEDLWVCNASADAKLYSFEPVDMPLNDFRPVETRDA